MKTLLHNIRTLFTILLSEKQDNDIYGQMRPCPPTEFEKRWPKPMELSQLEEYNHWKNYIKS